MNRSHHEFSSSVNWSAFVSRAARHCPLSHRVFLNSNSAAVSEIHSNCVSEGEAISGKWVIIGDGYTVCSTTDRFRTDKSRMYGGIGAGRIGSERRTISCCIDLTSSPPIMSLFMNIAIWRRSVELRGPRSCWTASLFMPTLTHFRRRQARHWFRWVLSTTHFPSVFALQT